MTAHPWPRNLHRLYRQFMDASKGYCNGDQRPMDADREKWSVYGNIQPFFDNTAATLVEVISVTYRGLSVPVLHLPTPRCASPQEGIAVVNKKWVPFVMGPRHLDMSEDDLKAEIKKMEPEILIIPSEAWRIVSLDEVKLEQPPSPPRLFPR